MAKFGNDFVGAAIKLSANALELVATASSISTIELRTVLAVETGGSGFDDQKRPIILYEPHVMDRVVKADKATQASLRKAGLSYPSWGEQPYPKGQDAQYQRLDAAVKIAGTSNAVQACSWGMGQVLGENYKIAGAASPRDMVADAMMSERAQVVQMLKFMASKQLISALTLHDWLTLAVGYNGKANASAYAAKLKAAYTKLSAGAAIDPAASRVVPNIVVALHPARPEDVSADDLTAKWAASAGLALPPLT